MGTVYVRCEVITRYPSSDSQENVNEIQIHGPSSDNLQEYPFKANDTILQSSYKATCSAYFWVFYIQ